MDHMKLAALLSSDPAFKVAYNKLANSIHYLKLADGALEKVHSAGGLLTGSTPAVVDVAKSIKDLGISLKDLLAIRVPGYDMELGKALLGMYGQDAANVVPALESIIKFSSQSDIIIGNDVVNYLLSGSGAAGGQHPYDVVLAYLKSPTTLDSLMNALSSVHDASDSDPANDPFGNMGKLDADLKALATAHHKALGQRGKWNLSASEKTTLVREKKIMEKHPEFIKGVMNAGSYFTFDKTPVIDPAVENPNQELTPTLNPNEITGKDIIGLATYAAGLIDPRVAVGPGGKGGALLDCVLRAVAEKDDGKYAGRLSSPTMDLVVSQTEKLLGTRAIVKPENQNNKYMNMAEKGHTADPAGEGETAEISKYDEPRIEEDATIERPVPRTTNKEASVEVEAKKEGEETAPAPKPTLVERLTGLGGEMKNRSPGAMAQAVKKVVRSEPAKSRTLLTKASSTLDAVAAQLEELGLKHLATELDIVSNSLDAANPAVQDSSKEAPASSSNTSPEAPNV